MKSKYERIIEVSAHLVRLEIQKGGLRWKATELAKTSKMARSRIYELLGKNKMEMRRNAVIFLLEELYSLSPERVKFDAAHGRLMGLKRSRELVRSVPELLAFYFRYRDGQNELGKDIRERETRFLDRVSSDLKITDPVNALFVRTMIHGISVAPFLDDSGAEVLAKKMAEVAKKCFYS